MRFAICDVERMHINELENYFAQKEELQIESEPFESGEALLDAYKQGQQSFDALFIDLEMGGLNGIETANAIRAIDERVIIVFVTSHEEYAIDCFQCSPLRFLKKPLQPEKVDEALGAIEQHLSKTRRIVHFTFDKAQYRLYEDDIIYLESCDHKVYIFTVDETYCVNTKLSELEDTLSADAFARAHKAFLVNLRYVKKIKGNEIYLRQCEQSIPLGRTYKSAFMKSYAHQRERDLCV